MTDSPDSSEPLDADLLEAQKALSEPVPEVPRVEKPSHTGFGLPCEHCELAKRVDVLEAEMRLLRGGYDRVLTVILDVQSSLHRVSKRVGAEP